MAVMQPDPAVSRLRPAAAPGTGPAAAPHPGSARSALTGRGPIDSPGLSLTW